MDEPTSGVDHESQESLAELLGGLVNEGASVLLVAHELGPLAPLVDRTLVLRDGRVDYDGPVTGGDVRGARAGPPPHRAARAGARGARGEGVLR